LEKTTALELVNQELHPVHVGLLSVKKVFMTRLEVKATYGETRLILDNIKSKNLDYTKLY